MFLSHYGGSGPSPAAVPAPRLPQEAAESHLRALVEVYQRGMREPLPLYVRTSAAWAEAMTEGSDPERAAAAAWLSGYDFEKEDKDAEHILVLGSVLPFKEMVQRAGAPRADEARWDVTEPTRFGAYARRTWAGLLEHEEIVDR